MPARPDLSILAAARGPFLVLALAGAVVGCGPQKKAETPRTQTLTIETGKAAASAAPAAPKAAGGKLAVMDAPADSPPAEQAQTSPAPAPIDHRTDGNFDPRRDPPSQDPSAGAELAEEGDGSITLHDCRQAERSGHPLADSSACRSLSGRSTAAVEDTQLVADCRYAARVGDPFADSRACRGLVGR